MSWNPLIVTVVALDDSGDAVYRMRNPAADIAALDSSLSVVTIAANAAERFDLARQADLLVLIQSGDVELLPIVKARRASGKVTLVEYNDNFFEPPAWSPVARAWSSPLLQSLYCDFMLSADAVMTTSQRLAHLLRERVGDLRDLTVVPNYLSDIPEPFEQLCAKKSAYPSLGWAGSLGHVADILAFAPQLNKILAAVPGSRIHIMGNAALPGLLELPSERLIFTPWSSLEAYLNFWQELRVGIAPLLPTAYNECRSDIKALEISSRAVAPILSDTAPYREFSRSCDVRLLGDFGAIGDVAIELLNNPDLASSIAERAYRYVSTNRVGITTTPRMELYKRLIEKTRSDRISRQPGLFHLSGEPRTRTPLVELIRKTQELLKAGEADQALTLLRAQVQECAFDGDIVLLYLKCLILVGRADVRSELSLARTRFPKDLRFELLELQLLAGDQAELVEAWEGLITKVSPQPDILRAFGGEIVALVGAQLERCPQLLSSAARVLELFPRAVSLRFRIAETLRRSKQEKAALHQYELLRDQKRELSFLRDLEAIELGYLEAWVAALTARLGSLSKQD